MKLKTHHVDCSVTLCDTLVPLQQVNVLIGKKHSAPFGETQAMLPSLQNVIDLSQENNFSRNAKNKPKCPGMQN